MKTVARTARVLTVAGLIAAALVATAGPGFAGVTPATLTLSSTQGPNTGGNMITATVPAGSVTFFPGVDVEFQVAATPATLCTATYALPRVPPRRAAASSTCPSRWSSPRTGWPSTFPASGRRH